MPASPALEPLKKSLLSRTGKGLKAGGLARLLRSLERKTRLSPPSAIRTSEAALTLARRAGDRPAEARLLRARAHALRAASRYREALGDYRSSLRICRDLGDPGESAVGRIGLIDTLMYLGRYDEAMEEARRARRYFARTGDVIRRARVENNIGNLHHRRDAHARALLWYDRARREFARAGDEAGGAIVDFNRGNVLGWLGHLGAARRAYGPARAFYLRRGLAARAAQVDYSLAYLSFLENRLPAALDELAAVRSRMTALGDRRHEALCRLDEAEILLRLNLWDDAAVAAREASETFADLGMGYEQARARVFAGVAAWRCGDAGEADRTFRGAIGTFAAEGNRLWQGETMLHLARLDLERGRWRSAVLRAGRAAGIARGTPWRGAVAEALLIEAIALRGLGRVRQAEDRLEQVLPLTRRRMPWLAAEASEVAGLVAADRGDAARARRRFRSAISRLENLRSLLTGDDLRAAFFRNREMPYLALARLELAAGRPREAFAILERGRARALLDLLTGPPAGRRRSAGRTRLERQAGAMLEKLGRHFHQETVIDEHGSRRAMSATAETGERWSVLESRATRLLGRLTGDRGRGLLPAVDPGAVQKALAGDEALISWFEMDGRLAAFRITRGSFSIVKDLADAAEVAGLAARLRFQWGRFRLAPAVLDRHRDQIDRLARADLQALHRLILGPVLGDRAPEKLVLVPTAALRSIPFAALHDGRRYLAERGASTVCPGAGVFLACRSRRGRTEAGRPGRLLLVGVADALSPQIAGEIRDLAALFPRSRILAGPVATVEGFRRAAGRARFIHIASHGVFRSDRPGFSGIRMEDRWLYGFDVTRLRLEAELVVLAACASGLSAVWGSGEWIGLARSFLSAGARRVLAGLWEVDDAATRALMVRFYAALRDGAGPGAALAGTQAALAREGLHPYYWSGFSLVGDP